MNPDTQAHRHHGFVIGLLTGAFVGVGLAAWLAPRAASELRQRLTDSARGLGRRASERYQRAGIRVGEAINELTRNGQAVRDDVAEVVARGAHQVEHYARAAKSDRAAQGGPRRMTP